MSVTIMTKKDFEVEFYKFIKEAKDRNMLNDMRKVIEKRSRELWEDDRNKEDIRHEQQIKKLPKGTKVLVRFGELANQTVEIVRHGAKRSTIKTKDGQLWYYSRHSLVYKPTEMDKMTAETNQKMTPLLNSIVSEVMK